MRVCSVAGTLMAGANCAYTGEDTTEELSMAKLIELLEGGALIVSSEDYKRNKTAAEQACYKLGPACGFEVRKAIEDADKRIQQVSPEKEKQWQL